MKFYSLTARITWLSITCAAVLHGVSVVRGDVTTGDVLAAYDKAVSAISKWSMQVTVRTGVGDSASASVHAPTLTFLATYLRDGDRRDISSMTPASGQNKQNGVAPVDLHHRAVVNGYLIAYDSRGARRPRYAIYAADGGKFVGIALQKTMSLEGAMEGRLSDPGRVADILRASPETRVVDKPESVDGQSCTVVTGGSRFGTLTLWCDPKLSYLPRKMVLSKTGPDLYGKQRVADLRLHAPSGKMTGVSKITYTVDSFTFQTFGAATLPTACRSAERYDFADGSWILSQDIISRDQIDLRPDLTKPGAFAPDLDSGTRLSNQQDPQLPYEWRDGRPVPWVNEQAIRHMDATADEFRARRQAGTTSAPGEKGK